MKDNERNSIMNRFVYSLFILFLCIGGAAGLATGEDDPCEYPDRAMLIGSSMEGNRSITVTDDSGREVAIRAYPKRIVSLAPSNTELLFAIGVGDRLVGVAEQSDYPAEARQIESMGGFTTISAEKVVSAKPDLVVAAPKNSEEVLNRLRSLGITVLIIDPATIDEILETIILLGRVSGAEDEAEALNQELSMRITAVEERVATRSNTPSVAHIVWHDPIWVSGDRTFQNEVIRTAGGRNAFAELDEWKIVGLEEFVSANPDYILVSSGTGMGKAGYDVIYTYVMTEPRLARLDAVQNGRVCIIESDVISRGGPRIVDALEEVAEALHPELYNPSVREMPQAEESSPIAVIPLIALFSLALFIQKRRRL
ncbi:cobalamin-binding protein [Methanocalculus taiwanensis]|uniref:Cobalamin-binding protein n=1 Tax=Methanocalculus taiwanensis TaxID=106207 RepID=A0ABD4TMK7_9EURY|nr:cobalamin-binding protein [Methanocalculus taiwanensis]MCQ1539080.1 cobalamin-binding protein [Methanocalculus taiwanensis]